MITFDLTLKRATPSFKRCTKCRRALPLESFYTQKRGLYGLRGRCKACLTAATRARSQDPTVKARTAVTSAAWRAANRERHAEAIASWRDANRERRSVVSAAWRAANPEKVRAIHQRRRARKAEATVEPFTPEELYAYWYEHSLDTGCYWGDGECDMTDMHIDHLQPLAKGGAHAVWNLVPSCAFHNLSKNDTDPFEFAARLHPWLAT